MIKAANIAASGMLQAERRATDVARKILEGTANMGKFEDHIDQSEALTDPSKPPSTPTITTSSQNQNTNDYGYADLIEDIVDLKANKHAFAANAKVFSEMAEMTDEMMGSVLDDEG